MSRFDRREYKYFVPLENLEPIRNRIMKNMKHDPYSEVRPNKNYCVRSIYFDTSRMLFYHEKIEGLKVRKKLRVRVYNNLEPNAVAFLEIKRKIDKYIYKERVRIPLAETVNLTNGAHLQLSNRDISFLETATLEKFKYLTKRLNLQPQVLITYEREAFVGLDDPTVRVTLDMNVRSYPHPFLEEIYREDDFNTIDDKNFILEVKFNWKMPVWARNIIRDFRLRVQAISKYCHGIDAWLPSFKAQGLRG